ncbi:Fc receptor-like protein 5 isoform X2 [Melanotaenia boesemani]|uniref:Fc receptor-like protein 5 isoform X2 n=1 Tax=Melanotaenia boesemani TaxID=1250792 RepID=UPI001C0503CB|nr:Fc receptor-like protein 5 isoform X2 [Melanotaenia boesemani]
MQPDKSMTKIHGIVMKNHRTFNLMPLLALASWLVKISESSSLHSELTGPDMAYLNSRVVFRCFTPSSSPPVTYELMRNSTFLIDTHVDQEGDQAAVFPLKVTAVSHGLYQCKVTAGGSSGFSNSIKLSIVTPASNTRVTSEPFPPVAYEGSRIILSCDVDRGSHLSYTWFFNRKEVASSMSDLHFSGNKLVIERVTPEHAGYYYCIAWSMVQDIRRFSTSTEVQLIIKVYVSKPKISFSIFKDGDNYHGNVTCWLSRGSPPVDFSLSIDDKEVGSVIASESLTVWFQVAMVPGLDMGEARCRVKTEMQELMSEPVTLEVVPVGGDLKVEVEYLYTAEAKLAAARLSCLITRGTFPHISWFFSNSALPSGSHLDSHIQPIIPQFGLTDHRQTLILPKLSQEDSGYYRCRARDSYDHSGPWVESADVLVQITDRILNSLPPVTSSTETSPKLHVTPIEVITVIFCCFFLVMLAVSSVCVIKMFDREQALVNTSPANSPAPHLFVPESQSAHMVDETSPADCDVQNQTIEITV